MQNEPEVEKEEGVEEQEKTQATEESHQNEADGAVRAAGISSLMQKTRKRKNREKPDTKVVKLSKTRLFMAKSKTS
jgi:hypothetical protein